MISDEKLFEFIAPLMYRAADKLFKFISWGIIIVALRYVHEVTKNEAVWYLNLMAIIVFGVALITQAFYLVLRDPKTLNVPESFHTASRVIQVVVGLVFLMILSSPYLFTDQILDAIQAARLKY